MTDYPIPHADAELFSKLRDLWENIDPIPEDLTDRIVAAVAIELPQTAEKPPQAPMVACAIPPRK